MHLRTRGPVLFGLFVSLIAALGCGTAATSPLSPNPSGGTPHFAQDIQPIFNAACAGCHSGSHPAESLPLNSGSAYANIVNIPATEEGSTMLVTPGDPARSYLYQKITESARFGDEMPPEGGLSSREVAAIRAWIQNGALND